MSSLCLHASCVTINECGVLLLGPSGVGKSDVALRMMAHGASLVSDDQTQIEQRGQALYASAPAALRGLIEARYVGLIKLPYVQETCLSLCVELVGPGRVLERLPEPQFYSLLGCKVRQIKVPAFEASTTAKIQMALLGEILNV